MYHYADGKDKAGNRLITSYKKAEQAERYRAGAKITAGELFLNLAGDGTGSMTFEEGDMLLRTLMVKDPRNCVELAGNFVVWGRINGKWAETQFRYPTYAAANTAVKGALITMFDACAVIEEDDHREGETSPAVNDGDGPEYV